MSSLICVMLLLLQICSGVSERSREDGNGGSCCIKVGLVGAPSLIHVRLCSKRMLSKDRFHLGFKHVMTLVHFWFSVFISNC